MIDVPIIDLCRYGDMSNLATLGSLFHDNQAEGSPTPGCADHGLGGNTRLPVAAVGARAGATVLPGQTVLDRATWRWP